jgi:peptide chain release factor 1
MLEKLDAIRARFDELGVALTNPEIIADNKKFGGLSKEYRSLEKIVQSHNQYLKILDDVEFYKEALNGTDEEMRELAKTELPEIEEKQKRMEADIRQMLIPKDPQDEKNAIIEIRAGTGGDEASLFAGDLLRMYMR